MGEKEMIFVRCDRCKKEIPFVGSFYKVKIQEEFTDGRVELNDESSPDRIVHLCRDCLGGLNLYLQKKVESYADLTKDYGGNK
jgi:hypothetical protein